jgi:hypothetical protein
LDIFVLFAARGFETQGRESARANVSNRPIWVGDAGACLIRAAVSVAV